MATKRTQISKRTRFEVFKRDLFTCQYCSAKPPKVPLEVDHIKPVSKGGNNSIDNLVTACFDCNRGKSNIELSNIPNSIEDKLLKKAIAVSQYKEYQKVLKKQSNQIESDLQTVESVYTGVYHDYTFTDKFRLSVKRFIKELGVDETINAMEIACSKRIANRHILSYFCGICWNKIKDL